MLLWLVISLCCGYGCTSGNKNKPAIINDTLAIQNLDITIPGSFSTQTDLYFDSSLIDSFLFKYKDFETVESELKYFYSVRKYALAWFNNNGITEQAEQLYNRMLHLKKDGLPDSTLYQTALITLFESDITDETRYEVDIMLTAQYFHYSRIIYEGLPEKVTTSLQWFIPRKKIALEALLDSLLQSPAADIFGHEPVYRQYPLLKAQLALYRQLAESDKGIMIIADKKLYKPGDSSSFILSVKNKLEVLGDLTHNNKSNAFDTALQYAVKDFQKRHGITENGIIAPVFLKELNTSINDRIRQIIINMERCRWIPEKVVGEYLVVNIPDFRLHAFLDGSLLWSMNVVVGRELRKTVVFNGEITHLVFSPYWNIPPGILRKDVLPAIRRNKNYLARNNMEIAGYDGGAPRIRQKPGKNNPLGGVKFMFPNSHLIYLHDSPSRSLFEKEDRAFSSGCVRLEDAEKLARYLLRHQPEWTGAAIENAMNAGKEQYVDLKKVMPVFLVYFTSWVDNNGKLNFRKDIYGRDKALHAMMYK